MQNTTLGDMTVTIKLSDLKTLLDAAYGKTSPNSKKKSFQISVEPVDTTSPESYVRNFFKKKSHTDPFDPFA